jgi:hypothetical protein
VPEPAAELPDYTKPDHPHAADPAWQTLARYDDAQMVEIMAQSSTPEAAKALREEWKGGDFRENMYHAAKVISTFNGTDFGKKLEEAGLLDHPDLWKQAARFGRALAEEATPPPRQPAAMPAARLAAMAELEAMQGEEREKFGKPEFSDRLFQSRRDGVYARAIEAGLL